MAKNNKVFIDIIANHDKAVAGLRRVTRSVATNTRKTNEHLARMQRKFDSVGRSVYRLVTLVAGFHTAQKGLRLSEEWNQLSNKLRIVSEDTQDLMSLQENLFRVSQATRTDYSATVQFYARAALATKELGIEQDGLIRLTRIVNEAVAAAGATASESSAGLIQFAQGLASNRLQGDELRSVLENLPTLADAIANGMTMMQNGVKVTRGDLRKLAADGELTADVIVEALYRQEKAVREIFRRSLMTVGQATTIFQNSTLRIIGILDQTTGFSKSLVDIILNLSNTISSINNTQIIEFKNIISDIIDGAKVAILVTGVGYLGGAVMALGKSVARAGGAIAFLNATLRANPIFWAASIAGGAITSLSLLRDNTQDLDYINAQLNDSYSRLNKEIPIHTGQIQDVKKAYEKLTEEKKKSLRVDLQIEIQNIEKITDKLEATLSKSFSKNYTTDALNYFEEDSAINELLNDLNKVSDLSDIAKARIGGLFSALNANLVNKDMQGFSQNLNTLYEKLNNIKDVEAAHALKELIAGFREKSNAVFDAQEQLGELKNKLDVINGKPILDIKENIVNVGEAVKKTGDEFRNFKDALQELDAVDFGFEQQLAALQKGGIESYEKIVMQQRAFSRAQQKQEKFKLKNEGGYSNSFDNIYKAELKNLQREKEVQNTLANIRSANTGRNTKKNSKDSIIHASFKDFDILDDELNNNIYQNYLKEINQLKQSGELARIAQENGISESKLETLLQSKAENEKIQRSKQAQDGIIRSFNMYIEQSKNMASQLEDITTNAFKGMEDAFVNFTQTGKLSFKDMRNSIINDLTRIMVKQAVMAPLGHIFKGLGNVFKGFFGAKPVKAAKGGYISGPGTPTSDNIPAMLSPGEFVVNAKSTKENLSLLQSINNSHSRIAKFALGGLAGKTSLPKPPVFGGSKQSNVQINIINNTQTPVNATTQPNSKGGFDIILEQIEKKIANGLSQQNSTLSDVLTQQFGLKKQPT